MQWTRYLLLALVLLQALSEAKRKKNNTKIKHDSRTHEDRARTSHSGISELQLSQEVPNQHMKHEGGHHQGGAHSAHSAHSAHRHHQHPTPEPYMLEQQPMTPEEQLEMRKSIRLLQIKDKVLTATGLLKPPNMTGVVISNNPDFHKIIEETTASAYTHEPLYNEDEPEIKSEKMFSPVEPDCKSRASDSSPLCLEATHSPSLFTVMVPSPAPPGLRIPAEMDVLYFKLNHEQLGNRVKRAILHVWLKPMYSELDRTVPVTVYKVSRPDNPDDFINTNEVTTVSESFDAMKGNWVDIEVFKLLQEWLNKPDENLGLVVTAYDSQGRQVAVTDPSEMPTNQAPLLEIHTEETIRNRSKRNSGSNSLCSNSNNKESRCCRYPLVVNFVDLGWDFIVAPKVYEANFCNGKCPFLHAHKYAHTTLIQKLNSTNAQHGPCCGARKLSPMKMLYYDHDHQIKFDTIQDMVVDRCGCS
ncbi:growth/differentiation factor 8 isoform X3 [Procambarus clarkii]|uniref:growth/differentiation factor 8 isoform X3 n=1 Tax=Procambarus clarkii TaxID=6728 RepID=UPI001E6744B4|nr:growth/differentiation factor 8-like isoform X3 [Procambarus clarkii]